MLIQVAQRFPAITCGFDFYSGQLEDFRDYLPEPVIIFNQENLPALHILLIPLRLHRRLESDEAFPLALNPGSAFSYGWTFSQIYSLTTTLMEVKHSSGKRHKHFGQ